MKLILIYLNGTRYVYKGFTISEMMLIIQQTNSWEWVECVGWELPE